MLLGLIFFFSIKECWWIPLWKFVFQHQRFLTEFVQLFQTVIHLLGFDQYLQTLVMQGQALSRWMNGVHWQQCISHWLSSVCGVRARTINQLRRKPSFKPSWTILCTWSLPFTLPALPPWQKAKFSPTTHVLQLGSRPCQMFFPRQLSALIVTWPVCQDRFFADLIFRGVRGSGHSLAVRPKGYVA